MCELVKLLFHALSDSRKASFREVLGLRHDWEPDLVEQCSGEQTLEHRG